MCIFVLSSREWIFISGDRSEVTVLWLIFNLLHKRTKTDAQTGNLHFFFFSLHKSPCSVNPGAGLIRDCLTVWSQTWPPSSPDTPTRTLNPMAQTGAGAGCWSVPFSCATALCSAWCAAQGSSSWSLCSTLKRALRPSPGSPPSVWRRSSSSVSYYNHCYWIRSDLWALSSVNVAAFACFAGPLGSALSNAYETRVVVMTGGCLAGLGLICASQATSLVHLYLTMGVTAGGRLSLPSLFLASSKEGRDPWLFIIFFLSSRFGLGAGVHAHAGNCYGPLHPAADPCAGCFSVQCGTLLLCF